MTTLVCSFLPFTFFHCHFNSLCSIILCFSLALVFVCTFFDRLCMTFVWSFSSTRFLFDHFFFCQSIFAFANWKLKIGEISDAIEHMPSAFCANAFFAQNRPNETMKKEMRWAQGDTTYHRETSVECNMQRTLQCLSMFRHFEQLTVLHVFRLHFGQIEVIMFWNSEIPSVLWPHLKIQSWRFDTFWVKIFIFNTEKW